ncbi:CDP-diacylglycerol--serine O-phosphatidyltransferase [Candidatus Woesearchaeota archaeon]|nr:CDP-diacylglycerol--serine O-phosphatidyltransferase [Candidatus Woesearchaeota archaeon]
MAERRRKRDIARAAAPSMFTLGNAAAGFLALLSITRGQMLNASAFLLGAMLFDMLDGQVARKLQVHSAFGLQLDSLADAVSFVVAPAAMIHFAFSDLLGVAVAIVAVACGISRLARFNVTANDSFYSGLSTPLFTFAVITLTLTEPGIPRWPLAAAFFLLSLAMVSKIPYPSFREPRLAKYKARAFAIVALGLAGWLLFSIEGHALVLMVHLLAWLLFLPLALEPLAEGWRMGLFAAGFITLELLLRNDTALLLLPAFYGLLGLPLIERCFRIPQTPT